MTSVKELKVPDMGDSSEMEIIEIAVTAGSVVSEGDVILTVETDKATMDIPSEQAGIIKELLVVVGDVITEGADFALLEINETLSDSESSQAEPTISEPSEKVVAVEKKAAHAIDEMIARPVLNVERRPNSTVVKSGPAARRLARELGIDIAQVQGSGRRQYVQKKDVKEYARSKLRRATPTASGQLPDLSRYGLVHREDMTTIEKVTSTNMQRAWSSIPHAWLQLNVDITEIESVRQQFKSSVPGLTMTAFIVKALADGMKEFPRFNAAIDTESLQLVFRQYIHIGVAVDTPRGLMIVVIRDVDQMSTIEISTELKRLSQQARESTLKPAEMKGASLTITNLGGIGVSGIQPIVNWPEVAILGVATSMLRPIYSGGQLVPRLILPLTLGFDHRVINGADGARFLKHIEALLTNPTSFVLQLS